MALLAQTRLAAPTALAALLLAAPMARAAVFTVIQSGPDTVTVMDPGAIEHLNGGPLLRAWSVTVKRNMVSGGAPQPGYVRTINEYDCDQRRLRWRTFTVYSRFGDVLLKKDNTDTAWGPAPLGNMGDADLRVVCDSGAGGSVVSAQSVGQLVLGLMSAWDAEPAPPPAASNLLLAPAKPKGKKAPAKKAPAKPPAHAAKKKT